MDKSQFMRRKTLAKSRYTLAGWLMPDKITQLRIYEPSYLLKSNKEVNFDHIQLIIRKCLLQEIEYFMPTYNPVNAKRFASNLSDDIKFRIKIQNFDRYRIIVTVNLTEKVYQGISWQVATQLNSTGDGWTSVEYETPTYVVNVFVACVYWD